MSEKKSLENEVQKGIAELTTMRDEIRVGLHLAAMDTKDQWKKLEPHVLRVTDFARDVTRSARDEVDDLVRRARVVRDAVRASKKPS